MNRTETRNAAKILLVRDRLRSLPTIALLKSIGLDAVCAPMISLAPVSDASALTGAMYQRVDSLLQQGIRPILVFTSVSAVEFFLRDARGIPRGALVAAVGDATKAELQGGGISVDINPGAEQNAESLSHEIVSFGEKMDEELYCLHPTSDKALPILRDLLTAAGVGYERIVTYTNQSVDYSAPQLRLMLSPNVDAIVLYSPSAGKSLVANASVLEMLPELGETPVIAIGETTAEALAHLGYPAKETADLPTPRGVVNALIRILGDKLKSK